MNCRVTVILASELVRTLWWHGRKARSEADQRQNRRAVTQADGTVDTVDNPMCRQRNRGRSGPTVPQAFILPSLPIRTFRAC